MKELIWVLYEILFKKEKRTIEFFEVRSYMHISR